MSFMLIRASLASTVVLVLAACGDDSTSTSAYGGGGSSQSGPNTSGQGGDDGTGGDASSSTSSPTSSSTSTSTSSSSQSGPTSSSSSGGGGSSTSSGACLPQCDDRVCGDDACGGSCGECDGELVCSNEGQCIAIDPESMSFFVTSVGNLSGDFGGLAGADAYCQGLAEAAGSLRQWHAYLSTSSVDARDRIGTGPWFNAAGAQIAASVAALHGDGLFSDDALDENGDAVPNGKTNPGFNEHDVLTGSNQDGTWSGADCSGWTSSGDGSATTGHCDASFTASGGSSPVDAGDNWNSSHDTNGCDPDRLNGTGSTARIYCFSGG